MIMAAMTNVISLAPTIPKHMEPLTAKLIEMGALVEERNDYIRVALFEGEQLESVSFKTMPYRFPTDLQPQQLYS